MINNKSKKVIDQKKIRKRKEYLFCYFMLAFGFYEIARYFVINFDSIIIAFSIRDINGNQVFSWNNWILLFQELKNFDSTIWIAIINTLKYFIMDIVKILLAFCVSYVLFKKLPAYKFFRTVFFLPSMVSPVILVLLFKDIIKPYGIVWYAVNKLFGYDLPNYLAMPGSATNVILLYVLWSGFGANLLLFIGAMNRIPDSILEAGKLDGCSSFKEFIYIVLPMGWDTLSTVLLLRIVSIFISSGPILYFTGGAYNTNTLSYWIFDQVRDGTYNYPTAVGLFFTVIAVPIVLLYNYITRRVSKDAEY